MTIGKILKGNTVELLPLQKSHFAELEILASDKRIWEFYTLDGSQPPRFREAFDIALLEMERGTQFPFVIFHKESNKLIGSTRFLDIQLHNRKLEIGWTWLHPDYWATVVNPECKLLMLTHCFEELDLVRVQFKTDENNLRSRNAIEKVGGQFEGVLRNDMIRDNGTKRNSAYYSIIDSEWPVVKMKLKKQIINLGAG
ncbi:MAG: GNAT family N-acetyltransferase [Ignavibacteria bacterium]|jgi:RimJ/RimL family protein N-acetyltransferase|nr:GNAT family N-acetyltransferase [Ignavibacteria bacterium]MBK6875112.1 GNAT family N-acetyltransferase [Ignavibacteria bacterium]MBK9228305.1 GNAT family N-acetyltransferase [Ignavibacteria bacterium]